MPDSAGNDGCGPAWDRAWLLFTMFTGVQHVSALIEMHLNLLLNLVRLELKSELKSIQPV